MPIRSLSALSRWLAPWAYAAIVIIGLVFTLAGPPLEMWPSMLAAALATLLVAGFLAALLFSGAASLLCMPPGSRRALGLAGVAGATVPFLPVAPTLGDAIVSSVVFAAVALIAAWRLAPTVVAETRARSRDTSARTT